MRWGRGSLPHVSPSEACCGGAHHGCPYRCRAHQVSYLIDLVSHYSMSVNNELGDQIAGSPFELFIVGGVSSAAHSVRLPPRPDHASATLPRLPSPPCDHGSTHAPPTSALLAAQVMRGVDLSESVAALPSTTAGSRYTCTVEARDSFSNARSRGGDSVAATCTGAETIEASAVDKGDGTYEVVPWLGLASCA